MHCVCSHLPDTVQFLVVTTEVATIFFGKIFILHGYFTNLYFRFVSDVHIAECFAVLQRIFIIRMMQRRCAADSEVSDLSRLQQEFIQCFAICFVFRLFRTFTIIEVNLSFARKILQCDKSESFFSKIIQYASFRLFCFSDRLLGFTHQAELGWTLGGTVKVPASGIHIDGGRCITSLTAFIDPFLIFISYPPGRIRVYRLSFHIDSGRRCLIPYFNI